MCGRPGRSYPPFCPSWRQPLRTTLMDDKGDGDGGGGVWLPHPPGARVRRRVAYTSWVGPSGLTRMGGGSPVGRVGCEGGRRAGVPNRCSSPG